MSLNNDLAAVDQYICQCMREGSQPSQDYAAAFSRISCALSRYAKENRTLRAAIHIVQQPEEKDDA